MNKNITTKDMIMCALFTALIAVGAFIKVPLAMLPITLQVLFVMLAGNMLKPKIAMLSGFLYMIIGIMGIPIFTGGGGISYVLKPSFGYIIGFAVAGYVIARVVLMFGKRTFVGYLVANLVGVVVIYAIGIAYYVLISQFVLGVPVDMNAIITGFIIAPIGGDVFKAVVSAMIALRVATGIKTT